MAAYGLYSHIQSNKRRSVVLLVGLFATVYLMVYAGALTAEALSYDASLNYLLRKAWLDLLAAAPWATAGTIAWIVIAYYFHQSMIDAVTGGRDVTRAEQPRLYNLLENLCISRGIPMPKFKVIESDALNAFASGMNEKQYAITVTTGLIDRLDDAEIEAVLGHELTHIRNGDVRMMVIAVVIAGAISFFAELFFRLWFYCGVRLPLAALQQQRGPRPRRQRARHHHRGRADRGRMDPLAADPLRAVALARIPRRCGLGRAHQEPRRDDLGAAQDRGPRRTARRDLRGDGDVRRQSARGIFQPVLDAPVGREPRQETGRDRPAATIPARWRCRRRRSRARTRCRRRTVKPARGGRRRTAAHAQPWGNAPDGTAPHEGPVGTLTAAPAADAAATTAAVEPAIPAGPPADRSRRSRQPVGQARRVTSRARSRSRTPSPARGEGWGGAAAARRSQASCRAELSFPLPDPPPRAGEGVQPPPLQRVHHHRENDAPARGRVRPRAGRRRRSRR